MLILDDHIHLGLNQQSGQPSRDENLKAMYASGVNGGNVFSIAPKRFTAFHPARAMSTQERIAHVLQWADPKAMLYPFFWIDPTEDDAVEQVRYAVDQGIYGFKIICSGHYPGDERAIPVYREMAKLDKPLMFHSGILYDGLVSSMYNRPAEFEAMLNVPGIKFSVAHFSWPWVDECIALFGKFNAAASSSAKTVKLYLDNAPGTPPIYRRDAIEKVYTVGMPVDDRVMFGVDSELNEYNGEYAREIIDRDNGIYEALKLSDGQIERIYNRNVQEFLGLA